MEIKIEIKEVHVHVDGGSEVAAAEDIRSKISEEWEKWACKINERIDKYYQLLEEFKNLREEPSVEIPVEKRSLDYARESGSKKHVGVKKGDKARTGVKICVTCKKEYKPTSNVQKFCSDACRDQANEDYQKKHYAKKRDRGAIGDIIKVCEVCKKEFAAKKITTKYCSDACRKAEAVRYNKEWYAKRGKAVKKADKAGVDDVLKEIEENKKKVYEFSNK